MPDTGLPRVNRRAVPSAQDLEWWDSILEAAILNRLGYTIGSLYDSIDGYGIIAEEDPSNEDGADTTKPLVCVVDPDDSSQIIVYPGTSINQEMQATVITAQLAVIVESLDVGAQSVVYLEYQHEDTELVGTRTRRNIVPARSSVVSEEELLKISTKDSYEALSTPTRRRTTALCLVTAQQNSESGDIELVVDMSQTTASYIRPWFSPVDIQHRKSVGSGTVSANNAHGLTINDLMAAGDLSLYDVLIRKGMIIAPSAGKTGVLGTLCTETIPGSRFETDTDGSFTGEIDAQYVRLMGYPVSIGSCVLIDGTEDTEDANALSLRLVAAMGSNLTREIGRSSIAYISADETVDDSATYEVRYSCVKFLEPPTELNTEGSLTFGSPENGEIAITEGFAFSELDNATLSLEGLGPIARRIYAIYRASDGLVVLPQVILPYSKLEDATNDEYDTSETTFYAPGTVRIWLTKAVENASLDVQITVEGTDPSGASFSVTVTFDGDWRENAAPATVELAAQMQEAGKFGFVEKISIANRENDGPHSAIVVEVMPDPVNEKGDLDNTLLVMVGHWDGFRVQSAVDARDISRNLITKTSGKARFIADAILGHHSIYPARGILNRVFGDDICDMKNSDLRQTSQFALYDTKDQNDSQGANSDGVLWQGDSLYYSKAFKLKDGQTWILVTLHGDVNTIVEATSGSAQFRYSIEDDPDTWSSWIAFDEFSGVSDGYRPYDRVRSYSKNLFDVDGFDGSDLMYKMQVRFSGTWDSINVFTSDLNLHDETAEALVADLSAAFEVEHYLQDSVSGNSAVQGQHRAMTVFADSIGKLKLGIRPYAGDTDNLAQITLFTTENTTLFIPAFSVDRTGAGFFLKSVAIGGGTWSWSTANARFETTSEVYVDNKTEATGNSTAANFVFGTAQTVPVEYDMTKAEGIASSADTDHVHTTVGYSINTKALVFSGLPFPGITNGGASWYIHLPIGNAFRNNGRLIGIELLVGCALSGSNTITMGINIGSYTQAGTVDTETEISGADATAVLLEDDSRQLLTFTFASPLSLTSGNIYRLKIRESVAGVGNQFVILRIRFLYSETSLKQILGVP